MGPAKNKHNLAEVSGGVAHAKNLLGEVGLDESGAGDGLPFAFESGELVHGLQEGGELFLGPASGEGLINGISGIGLTVSLTKASANFVGGEVPGGGVGMKPADDAGGAVVGGGEPGFDLRALDAVFFVLSSHGFWVSGLFRKGVKSFFGFDLRGVLLGGWAGGGPGFEGVGGVGGFGAVFDPVCLPGVGGFLSGEGAALGGVGGLAFEEAAVVFAEVLSVLHLARVAGAGGLQNVGNSCALVTGGFGDPLAVGVAGALDQFAGAEAGALGIADEKEARGEGVGEGLEF